MNDALDALQRHVSNLLGAAPDDALICGLIGDHPSSYSRSPAIWNAAFAQIGLEAHYVPLDVAAAGVADVIEEIRRSPRILGVNVTVPHKQAVIPYLDELHPSAERLGAVNTIWREPDGRLLGANTDGRGAVDSVTTAWRDGLPAFLPSLERKSVLLIGAGGSGRAVAFAVAEAVGAHGRLFIANRTPETALALGESVNAHFGNAHGLDESDAELLAPGIDLVINSSTRGQAGARSAGQGRVTYLEPYSALGAANPPSLPDDPLEGESERMRRWFVEALPDIRANHEASVRFVTSAARHTAFFDLIYAPPETMTLRHARWSGHGTLNGQGMILCQAIAGFVDFIVRDQLDRLGIEPAVARRAVQQAMARAL